MLYFQEFFFRFGVCLDFKTWATFPVNGVHVVNQELQKPIHILLVFDYKVDVPRFELECQALPSIERHLRVSILEQVDWIHVLSVEPEPGLRRPKNNALNIFNFVPSTYFIFQNLDIIIAAIISHLWSKVLYRLKIFLTFDKVVIELKKIHIFSE